jgi:hypothetical protein
MNEDVSIVSSDSLCKDQKVASFWSAEVKLVEASRKPLFRSSPKRVFRRNEANVAQCSANLETVHVIRTRNSFAVLNGCDLWLIVRRVDRTPIRDSERDSSKLMNNCGLEKASVEQANTESTEKGQI